MEQLLIELIQEDLLIYKKPDKKNLTSYNTLNPQEILLDLKQQIKIFKEVKKMRHYTFCVYVEDNYIEEILELISKELKNDRLVICSPSKFNFLKKNDAIVTVIGSISPTTKKFFIENDIFIISMLGIKNNNFEGFYKVNSMFNTLKKIVWFLSLLDFSIKK